MESSISLWCCTSTARSWNSAATSFSDLRGEREQGGKSAGAAVSSNGGPARTYGSRHLALSPLRALAHLTSISTSLARDCASVYACCASSLASSRIASRMTPDGSLDASCARGGRRQAGTARLSE